MLRFDSPETDQKREASAGTDLRETGLREAPVSSYRAGADTTL